MAEKTTPPVPQTYEEFHKCMEFLKKKNEQSDKFNEVIQELTVQYNKTRRQLITNELLDMMGGEIAN